MYKILIHIICYEKWVKMMLGAKAEEAQDDPDQACLELPTSYQIQTTD